MHCMHWPTPSGKATLSAIARDYVWHKLRKDVMSWAKECIECQRNKIGRHTQPPVQTIPVPPTKFTHVYVGLGGPFTKMKGFEYVLTMIDRTTRWAEAVPVPDMKAETVTDAFISGWIARFGVPSVVTHDRGVQFTANLWIDLMKKLGIQMVTTTAYHPQSNGMVERFHRTLKL